MPVLGTFFWRWLLSSPDILFEYAWPSLDCHRAGRLWLRVECGAARHDECRGRRLQRPY